MFVSPAVAGDAVLLGSCSGSLYALQRTSGEPIWLYDTRADGARAQFHGEPLLLGDRFIIPTDANPTGHLYSFDVTAGDLAWKVPFKSGVLASPLLVGDRVVVASAEGELAAIEAKTGKVAWRVMPAGALKAAPWIQAPALAGNRIIFADNTGKLFAINAADGRTIWSKSLAARPNTNLVTLGKSVVVGTPDNHLNWIDPQTGAVTKRMPLEGMPYGTLMPAGSLLLVLTSGASSKLLAIDPQTATVKWEQATAQEWTTYRPLVTGSMVIVGNQEKDLCAFELAGGTQRWCRPVGQVPRGLGISKDGVLYVGSLSGIVQAYRMR